MSANATFESDSRTKSRRKVSRRFCYLLEAGGWKKQKEDAETLTFLYEVVCHNETSYPNVYFYMGGSGAEGTSVMLSDVDSMYIHPSIFVVTNEEDASRIPSSTAVFLVEQEGRRPCYPVLRLIRLGSQDWIRSLSLLENHSGFEYLSSERMKHEQMKKCRQLLGRENIHEHGPCVQLNVDLSFTFTFDIAYSFACTSWPSCAYEWIIRDRKYNVPSREIIHKVVDTACSMVYKCNDTTRNVEWRISFLLGERILVWNFTNTQYYCYIFLKHISRKFFPDEIKEIISSFVLKTILFWETEETNPDLWQEENLLDCITNCLVRLKHCIQKRHLPHYFARDNNILKGKLSLEGRQNIVFNLSHITENVIHFCHECFGIKCSVSSCVICNDVPLLISTKGKGISPWMVIDYFDNRLHREMPIESENFKDDVMALRRLFSDKVTKCNSPCFVEYMRDAIAIKIGVICHRKAMYKSNANDITAAYNSLAEQFLRLSASNDIGNLHLSGFYCQLGRFKKSLQINNKLTSKIYIDTENNKFIRYTDGNVFVDEDIFVGELTDARALTPMHFYSQDTSRVHYVLAMECITTTNYDNVNNSVQIHAFVYLAFLHFLILSQGSSLEKIRSNLKQMEKIAMLSKGKKAYSTACNIIGYCYYVIGNNIKALEYFLLSYDKRPSLLNPCLYHAIILIKRHAESKKQ